MKANDMHQFHYYSGTFNNIHWVYQSEKRGDWWDCTNVPTYLTDATYNSDYAKAKDIKQLRDYIKKHGKHYNSIGVEIPEPIR